MDGDGETAPAEMLALARKLYTRRATGTVVPDKQLDSNHTEGQCHQNAGIWASDNAGWKVVHGWLVFDFERDTLGLVPLVWFNPHSVVEDPNGTRIDPTPAAKASQRYPFLGHDGTRDEFIKIADGMSLVRIEYDVPNDNIRVVVLDAI